MTALGGFATVRFWAEMFITGRSPYGGNWPKDEPAAREMVVWVTTRHAFE